MRIKQVTQLTVIFCLQERLQQNGSFIALNMSQYNNACLGVTSQPTPDPFITYARGKFYFTFTGGDRVPLWEADSITDFWEEGKFKKGPVW